VTQEMPPPRRRNLRLTGYDYASAGAYFVTICIHRRALLFEDSRLAGIARDVWSNLPSHYANIALDEFVVMPNHLHGILLIKELDQTGWTVGTGPAPVPGLGRAGCNPATTNHGLPEIVRAFKTF
jgi:putative transposase